MPPYFVALSPHNWVLEMHNLLWRWAEMRGRGECRFFSLAISLCQRSALLAIAGWGEKRAPLGFPVWELLEVTGEFGARSFSKKRFSTNHFQCLTA